MSKSPEELGYLAAQVTMLTPNEGDRHLAIQTGYCPNWWLPGEPDRVFASACIELVGRDRLRPGTSGTVRIYPLAPELWSNVEPGSQLDMSEGPAFTVGRALVTRVVPGTVPVASS